MQLASQPSPELRLPSSHSSLGSSRPLPQLGLRRSGARSGPSGGARSGPGGGARSGPKAASAIGHWPGFPLAPADAVSARSVRPQPSPLLPSRTRPTASHRFVNAIRTEFYSVLGFRRPRPRPPGEAGRREALPTRSRRKHEQGETEERGRRTNRILPFLSASGCPFLPVFR